MGFPQISVFGANPVFQTLAAQGKTTQNVFGVTLRTSGSELFLGGTDSSKFTGTTTFTPVTQVGFWEITLGGATVGGRSVAGAQDAIVDTGTTLLIGDTTSVKAVYAAIPGSKDASRTVGAGFFTVPCASVPSNVGLTLGGRTFTISAATFNLGQVSSGSADCVGGLIADDSEGFWIIGDVFLQNVYTSKSTLALLAFRHNLIRPLAQLSMSATNASDLQLSGRRTLSFQCSDFHLNSSFLQYHCITCFDWT